MIEQKGLTCGERILLVFRRKREENAQSGSITQVFATETELLAAFEDGDRPDGVSFGTCMLRMCKRHIDEVREGEFCLTSEGRQTLGALELRLQKSLEQTTNETRQEERYVRGLSLATM